MDHFDTMLAKPRNENEFRTKNTLEKNPGVIVHENGLHLTRGNSHSSNLMHKFQNGSTGKIQIHTLSPSFLLLPVVSKKTQEIGYQVIHDLIPSNMRVWIAPSIFEKNKEIIEDMLKYTNLRNFRARGRYLKKGEILHLMLEVFPKHINAGKRVVQRRNYTR